MPLPTRQSTHFTLLGQKTRNGGGISDGTLNITCEKCRELNEIIPDGTDKIEKCMACGAYFVDVIESWEPSRVGGNAAKQTDANNSQKKFGPGESTARKAEADTSQKKRS